MSNSEIDVTTTEQGLPSVQETTASFWAQLHQYAVIRFSGPDVRKFLQGQFTCDINTISPTESRLGACCTPKGRMLALFRLAQVGEEIWLRLPRELAQSLTDHLKKYMVFFKASMVLDESIQVTGLVAADDSFQTLDLPQSPDQSVATENTVCIRVPGTTPRYEIWSAQAEELLQQDLQKPENLWTLSDIVAGLGEVYATTLEEFIPQMLNLQSLNGVSFKKGCYTGQEIVARMQYLGTLKRRMYLGQLNSSTTPLPGTAVVTSEGNSLGTIVRAQATSDEGVQVLAVLNQESLADGVIPHIQESDSLIPLQWREVPYPVELISNPRKKI